MIVTLQLSPGTVLSEQALAVRLKIGRTRSAKPCSGSRETDLVVIMPRRGIMVSEINFEAAAAACSRYGGELERLMASLAAERATPEETSRIRRSGRSHARRSRKGRRHRIHAPRPALQHPDRDSGPKTNSPGDSMGLMNALSRRFWYQHYQEVADLPLAAKLHAAVAEAVAQKKVKAADACVGNPRCSRSAGPTRSPCGLHLFCATASATAACSFGRERRSATS